MGDVRPVVDQNDVPDPRKDHNLKQKYINIQKQETNPDFE